MNADHGGPEPELCDLCGLVIIDDSQVYALVPDAVAPLGERRLITACGEDHLEELRRGYA